MTTASLINNIEFKDKPAIQALLETSNTKEIRIVMRKGQTMTEHKTPFPIVVEIFDGEIEFGVEGDVLHLSQGDLITLEGNVPHDLKANTDCIIRLSLSKLDSVKRVKDLVG